MPPNKRKKRPKPFTTKEEGEALLFLACKRNYPRKVKTLIDYHDVSSEAFYGKKKNAKGRGITPIIIAARSGHIDIVSTLITLGANVQQEDRNQWNALHWACKVRDLHFYHINTKPFVTAGAFQHCKTPNQQRPRPSKAK
mmetsp:Transcript_10732/g.20137  ORF Transcript_10732/g.20137 Transcript_10732/m.20137 type:complete len:140 (+) Transcript_10732:1637-2056(+)